MALSLLQLASMVQNNVSGGLRGQQNFTYSMEQLMDEITLERNGLLKDLEMAGKTLPLNECAQQLNAVELAPADYARIPAGVLSLAGLENQVRSPVLHFRLPSPLLSLSKTASAVRYCGPVQRRAPWRVATTQDQVHYREFTRLRHSIPLVYFVGTDGWVLASHVPQRTISLDVVLENPRAEGAGIGEEHAYPMPDFLARDVVQKLTNKYVSQYGRLAVRPNDGTAQV